MAVEPGDEFGDLAHRGNVGGDVEGVGDQQQPDDAKQHRAGEAGADIPGEPLAGDAPDIAAHQLDRRHQRKAQRHGPQHPEAELRAGLRIGGDAAWVVVRDAGDKAGADARQRMLLQPAPARARSVAENRHANPDLCDFASIPARSSPLYRRAAA
jgi:hypothetical protein